MVFHLPDDDYEVVLTAVRAALGTARGRLRYYNSGQARLTTNSPEERAELASEQVLALKLVLIRLEEQGAVLVR